MANAMLLAATGASIGVIVALAAGGQQDAPLSPACPVPAWSIALNQRIAADQAAAGPHAPVTEAAEGKLCSASFDFHASSRLSSVPLCKPLCVPIRHQSADNPSLHAKQ